MGSRSLTPSNSLLACAARPGLTLGAAALLPPAEAATLNLSPSKPKVGSDQPANAEFGDNENSQFSYSNPKLGKVAATGPNQDDDDFDIESYYARLHAIPSTVGLQAMEKSNPVEDSNFSEIDLNSSSVGQAYANEESTGSQGITSDLAQNLSQLPQVLPQVANTVLSSFTSILNLGRSTITGTVDVSNDDSQMNVYGVSVDSSNVYHNSQSYDESLPAVPLFNREEFPERKPVCGQNINLAANPAQVQTIPENASLISKDNENAPKNAFRLNSKKKKTYAHVPGLTLGEMQTSPVVPNMSEHRIIQPMFRADYENQNRPADIPMGIEIPAIPHSNYPQPFGQNTNASFESSKIPLRHESFNNSTNQPQIQKENIYFNNASPMISDQNIEMHYKQSLVKDNISIMQSSQTSNNATSYPNVNILTPVVPSDNIHSFPANPLFSGLKDNSSTQNFVNIDNNLLDSNIQTQPPAISNLPPNINTQISSCNTIENQHLVHHPYIAMDNTNQQLFSRNSNQFVTSCFETPIVSARETVSNNMPIEIFHPNFESQDPKSAGFTTNNSSYSSNMEQIDTKIIQNPDITPLSNSFQQTVHLNYDEPNKASDDMQSNLRKENLQNIPPLPHQMIDAQTGSFSSLENSNKTELTSEHVFSDSTTQQGNIVGPPVFFNPNSLTSSISNTIINNPIKPPDVSNLSSEKPPTIPIGASNANSFRMKSFKTRPKYYSGPIDFSSGHQNNAIDNREFPTGIPNNQPTVTSYALNNPINQNDPLYNSFNPTPQPEKSSSGFGFSVFQNLSKIQNTVTSLFAPAENQPSDNTTDNIHNPYPSTVHSLHSFSLNTQNNTTEEPILNQQNFYTNQPQQQNYFYNPNQFVSVSNNDIKPNAPLLAPYSSPSSNVNDFTSNINVNHAKETESNQYNYFYEQQINYQAENNVLSNDASSTFAENNSKIVFQNDNNEILQASQYFNQPIAINDENKNSHEPTKSILLPESIGFATNPENILHSDYSVKSNETPKFEDFFNQPTYINQQSNVHPNEPCLPPPLQSNNLMIGTRHIESEIISDANQSTQYNLFYSELMNPDKDEQKSSDLALSNKNNSGNFDSNQTSQLYETNTNEKETNNVNNSLLLTSYGSSNATESNLSNSSSNVESVSQFQNIGKSTHQNSQHFYNINFINNAAPNENSMSLNNVQISTSAVPVDSSENVCFEDYVIEPCHDTDNNKLTEEATNPLHNFDFDDKNDNNLDKDCSILKGYSVLFDNSNNDSASFFDTKKPTEDNPYLEKQNKHESLDKENDSSDKAHYELFSAFANDNAIKEFHLFEPNKNSATIPFGNTARNYVRLNSQSSEILTDKNQHSLLESQIQKESSEHEKKKITLYNQPINVSHESTSTDNDPMYSLLEFNKINEDMTCFNELMASPETINTEQFENPDSVEKGNEDLSEDESLKADNEVKEILSNVNDNFLNKNIPNVKPFSSGTKIQNSLIKEEALRILKDEVDEILLGGPKPHYPPILNNPQELPETKSVSNLFEKLNLDTDDSEINKFDDDYLNPNSNNLNLLQPNLPIDYSNLNNEPFESTYDDLSKQKLLNPENNPQPTNSMENIELPFESSNIVQYDALDNSELSIRNNYRQQESFDGSNFSQPYGHFKSPENSTVGYSDILEQSDVFVNTENVSEPNIYNSNIFKKLDDFPDILQQPHKIEQYQDSSIDSNIPQQDIFNTIKTPEIPMGNNDNIHQDGLRSFPVSLNTELSKSFFNNNEFAFSESVNSIGVLDQNKSEVLTTDTSNIDNCKKESENNLVSKNSSAPNVEKDKDVPLFNYFSMMPQSGQSDFKL